MDVIGILKVKNGEQVISEKFKKREFVMSTDTSSQYPQMVAFQLTQDKCSLIDQFSVGDEIKVHFNLRGREWKSPQGEMKYFNTLEAWRLERITAGNPASPVQRQQAAPQADAPLDTTFSVTDDSDDLPF